MEDYEEHPVASLHPRKAEEHDADYSQCELNIISYNLTILIKTIFKAGMMSL